MREQLNIQMTELTDEEIAQVVGGEFALGGMGAFGFNPFFSPFAFSPFSSPLAFNPFLGACGVCGLGVGVPTILPAVVPTPFLGGCGIC